MGRFGGLCCDVANPAPIRAGVCFASCCADYFGRDWPCAWVDSGSVRYDRVCVDVSPAHSVLRRTDLYRTGPWAKPGNPEMSTSLILAFVWLAGANVLAMFPSRDYHWRNAYILIAMGVPLVIYVGVQNGFWVALLVLAGAMSILRWPVIYLGRWVRKLVRR